MKAKHWYDYLWVTAGADGEAALVLRIDKPQLRVTFMKVLLYTLKSEKTAK